MIILKGTASRPGAEGTPWTSTVWGVGKISVGTSRAWPDLHTVLSRSITRYEKSHSSSKAALIGYVWPMARSAWMNGETGK